MLMFLQGLPFIRSQVSHLWTLQRKLPLSTELERKGRLSALPRLAKGVSFIISFFLSSLLP